MLLRSHSGRRRVQEFFCKTLFSGQPSPACRHHNTHCVPSCSNLSIGLISPVNNLGEKNASCNRASCFSTFIRRNGSRCYSAPATPSASKTKPAKFRVLDGDVDSSAPAFRERLERSRRVEGEHCRLESAARAGGGEKAMERHVKGHKKLFVRDRLRLLLDECCQDSFLEIGTLAGMGMPYGDVPGASTIAGVGKINGTWCAISASDGTVKGGTVYPIGVKKQLRIQEIGLDNRLPCVYVVDSGGAFLPLQAEIFPDKEHGGKTFANEAQFSALKIPQVAIVCGSCTAGGAYLPAMCEEAVIVDRIGTIFLGGPPLVYAATGEKVSAENLGGATLHCKISGVTDHFAADEEEAFATGRDIIAGLNARQPVEYEGWDEPIYSEDDLLGLDLDAPGSMKKVISRLVDGSRFHEFKSMYGSTLVTGMAFIKGHLVGVLGNDGPLTAEAASKGAHFVETCCQRRIPLIFLQNTAPETRLPEAGEGAGDAGDTIRNRARMMMAVACAQVPKMTVVVGNSYGPSNFAMCGRSFGPRFLFMWPSARIGITSPEDADSLTSQMAETDGDGGAAFDAELMQGYERQASSLYSSGRLWDDGIILPQHTRQVLGVCLSIVSQHREEGHTNFGIFRM